MADLTPPPSLHNTPQRTSIADNAKANPTSPTPASSGAPTRTLAPERQSGDALDSPPTSDDDDLEGRLGAGASGVGGDEDGIEGMEYEEGEEVDDELDEEFSDGGEGDAVQADAGGDLDDQWGGGQAQEGQEGPEGQAEGEDVMLVDDNTGGGGATGDTGVAAAAVPGVQGQPAEGRVLRSKGKGKGKAKAPATAPANTRAKRGAAGGQTAAAGGARGAKKDDLFENNVVQAWNDEIGDVCQISSATKA